MNNARTTFASDRQQNRLIYANQRIKKFNSFSELENVTVRSALVTRSVGKLGSFLARSRKSKFLNSKLVLCEIDKHAINNTELIRLEPRSLVSLGGTSPYQVLPSGRWSLRTRNLTFSFRKNPIHL